MTYKTTMKKYILILILSLAAISCKKESADSSNCYECDAGDGYKDKGCMTNEEYDRLQLTDQSGNVCGEKV